MIRIAYLIQAFNNPEQLKRLVNSLFDSGDFYIHIDKKSDITPFLELLGSYSNVYFLNNRIRVSWAGWSVAKAYLVLLEAAFMSAKKYNRFVMLTGQDYPISSNSNIIREFEAHPETEYIMAYKISSSTIPTDKNKVLNRWFLDNPFDNSFLKRCWASVMYRVFTRHFFTRRTLLVPLDGKMVEPYFGQMLSAFTRNGADLILKAYHCDKSYNRVMKHVHAPDELYWQTIIFNSQLRHNTVQNGEEHEICEHFGFAPLHYLTYYDVCSEFDEKDYDDIISSNMMFFRKVVVGKSEKLMDMIDERRSREENHPDCCQ